MALFRAVRALGKPMAVFIMSAGGVDIADIKESGVPIVAAGYGGEYGGQATADVLTGAYNPGGALTLTWYREEYRRTVSFRDMTMRPANANGHIGRSYRFLDQAKSTPLWRFGWGLSYTTFAIEFELPPLSPVGKGDDTRLAVTVHNTGSVAGGIAIICYVAALNQTLVRDAPTRSVFDFARAGPLGPGEKSVVGFTLTAESRGLVNMLGDVVYPDGTYSVQCEAGGAASTPVAKIKVLST